MESKKSQCDKKCRISHILFLYGLYRDYQLLQTILFGNRNSCSVRGISTFMVSTDTRACGVARDALELAVKYAKKWVQFGRPIAGFQEISRMLADMEAESGMHLPEEECNCTLNR